MPPYPSLRGIACGLLLVSLCPAQAPNIVVFLADDMGVGDTSAYQDWTKNSDATQVHTPHLARLAAQGVRFTDAHAPSSRCSPTRYALLTGRYCWRTHLKQWVLFGVQCDPLIERSRRTLPEFLREHGYRTGMVGKWHLGLKYQNDQGKPARGWNAADLSKPLADSPLDHGFDSFYGVSRSHPTSGPDGQKRNQPRQRIGPGWIDGRRVVGATEDGKKLDGSYVLREVGPVLHTRARRFLEASVAQHAKQPFFLYFAAVANHRPFTPCDAIDGNKVRGGSSFVDGSPTRSERLDFIHENDVQVGLLRTWLAETDDPRRPGHKLADNTLFVFASDNGSESRSKTATGPMRSFKGSTYEGGHRIPFLVAWPNGELGVGASSAHLLGLNDLFATFAEVLGEALPDADGCAEDSVSQLTAMRLGEATPRAPLFPNDHKEAIAGRKGADKKERAWIAVRSNATPVPGQWKLFLDHRYAFAGECHPKELYELGTDPMESNNRLADPAAKAALTFLLAQARSAAGDTGRTR